MDFNYDSAGIQLTDIPLPAMANFFPSSADVSENLNSVLSVFCLFLAISEKNVVHVEVPPGASVGDPAASSNWALARCLASATSAAV